ncbi:MAG: OmpA family protein [Bdellovibrionales bacterium]|nr:OmpA family protein [Bdellovibrionales bacterium]
MKFKIQKTLLLICAISFVACENSNIGAREKGAVSGGLLGAGLGAIIGHKTGEPGVGVAIGAAAGLLGGGLIGNEIDKEDARLNERDRMIEDQERVLQENKKIIEELRKRGADVRSTDRGVVVNLPDVLFEFDSYRLTSEARDTAKDIADVIAGIDNRNVSVEGHTDSVGSLEYNEKLSLNRAQAVADELVVNGISRSQVRTYGYGETAPIATNKTEYGRKRNRRVEVIIENSR